MASEISDEIGQEVVSVIESIRRQVVWKPGKDQQHLDKRKSMGHMPHRTICKNISINGDLNTWERQVNLCEIKTSRILQSCG